VGGRGGEYSPAPLYAEGTDAMERDEEDFIGSDAANFQRAVNPDIFNYYNPERMVVESLHEDDIERVKAFYARLTDFERGILECRREGLTLTKIAGKFKCHVTTVKLHLKRAKKIASAEFQIEYA
jgi:DNA-directed RNA polymerase specialized sigma24 family protein